MEPDRGPSLRERGWPFQAGALVAIFVLAYADTALFAGALRLPRRVFLVPHIALVATTTIVYARMNGISLLRMLRRRWKSGVAWAAVFAAVGLVKVFASPASEIAQGWQLAADVLWSGVAYGAADAVLLSVLPMVAVTRGFAAAGLSKDLRGRVVMRAVAVIVALGVSVTFHAGFPGLADRDLAGAAFGTGVMATGYLASGSVLTPVLSHMVVHVGAVLHGPRTTALLPPH